MRASLGSSSGFQSDQYRQIEFLMGAKNAAMIDVHEADAQVQATLRAELHAPSLYDEALRLLARRGLPVPPEELDRDFSLPRQPTAAVEQCWATIYADPERYWDLYDLAEKLVDLEYHFQLWRFGHLKTVQRVIGFKTGTGGTPGVAYLAKVIEQQFFPELISVRTNL
jgi:tryptophan 2,3-dioxygenase